MTDRIKTVGWVLIILGIWGYVQDMEYTEQRAYTRELEKVLAKCLSGGDQPIQIGDELWLCGAARTGVKI